MPRHAGLAIIGSLTARCSARWECATLSEEIVLASGRACLLLPPDCPPEPVGRRIVVGWNGSREAIRALADAMPLLMEAEAVLVIVVEEPKTRGLLHGEEPGRGHLPPSRPVRRSSHAGTGARGSSRRDTLGQGKGIQR